MSDEKSSKTAYQDSNNGSVTSSGTNNPIAIGRVNVTDRGAVFIIAALALGLAGWATARVGYLHDEMIRQASDANSRAEAQARAFMYHATELQADYLLHTAQQAEETQNEIAHYRERFQALERQYRMTELKFDDTSVVLHRAGLQLPGDYTRGPQGSLDAESFHVNTKR